MQFVSVWLSLSSCNRKQYVDCRVWPQLRRLILNNQVTTPRNPGGMLRKWILRRLVGLSIPVVDRTYNVHLLTALCWVMLLHSNCVAVEVSRAVFVRSLEAETLSTVAFNWSCSQCPVSQYYLNWRDCCYLSNTCNAAVLYSLTTNSYVYRHSSAFLECVSACVCVQVRVYINERLILEVWLLWADNTHTSAFVSVYLAGV